MDQIHTTPGGKINKIVVYYNKFLLYLFDWRLRSKIVQSVFSGSMCFQLIQQFFSFSFPLPILTWDFGNINLTIRLGASFCRLGHV